MPKNQLAFEIIEDSISEMHLPLAKLKAISELVWAATDSRRDLAIKKLKGLNEILDDIADRWEKLIEKADHAYIEDRDRKN